MPTGIFHGTVMDIGLAGIPHPEKLTKPAAVAAASKAIL